MSEYLEDMRSLLVGLTDVSRSIYSVQPHFGSCVSVLVAQRETYTTPGIENRMTRSQQVCDEDSVAVWIVLMQEPVYCS